MNSLDRRIAALEGRQGQPSGAWHRMVWEAGQTWANVLAANGHGDDIRPGDRVILRKVVAADDGRRLPDPVMEREGPIASAWLRDRTEGGSGLRNSSIPMGEA